MSFVDKFTIENKKKFAHFLFLYIQATEEKKQIYLLRVINLL